MTGKLAKKFHGVGIGPISQKYKGLVLLHEVVKLHIKISQVLMKDL